MIGERVEVKLRRPICSHISLNEFAEWKPWAVIDTFEP